MGIDRRVETLSEAAASPTRKKTIKDSANRLVDLTGMGKQYKVLGLTGTGPAAEGPTGFGVWPFYDLEEIMRQKRMEKS